MDYISRKDTIKDIQHYGVGSQDFENYTPEQAERFVITRLNNLPAADVVERRKGRWVKWGSRVKCDQCSLCNSYEKPYCPNCGAEMEGNE